jgi:hypothetical protein
MFFPKIREIRIAEICEKQQGKKSAKSLFLTCCQGNRTSPFLAKQNPNDKTI